MGTILVSVPMMMTVLYIYAKFTEMRSYINLRGAYGAVCSCKEWYSLELHSIALLLWWLMAFCGWGNARLIPFQHRLICRIKSWNFSVNISLDAWLFFAQFPCLYVVISKMHDGIFERIELTSVLILLFVIILLPFIYIPLLSLTIVPLYKYHRANMVTNPKYVILMKRMLVLSMICVVSDVTCSTSSINQHLDFVHRYVPTSRAPDQKSDLYMSGRHRANSRISVDIFT